MALSRIAAHGASRFLRITLFASIYLLATQILGSAQGQSRLWYQYGSEEGGFTFTAPSGVNVKEEIVPASPGHMRSVRASVDLGLAGHYSAETFFIPVSLANREDADKEFSSRFKSIYSSACAEVRFEKTTVQGLPAQLISASKCAKAPGVRHFGLWVFAGSRVFTFDSYALSARSDNSKRLLASFKIADPRFVSRGEWLTFESAFGGFSVSLPGFPLHHAVSARGGVVYTLEDYAFLASAIPAIPGKPSEILDAMEKMVQSQFHGTVFERTDLTSEGFPARTFKVSFQSPEGNFVNSVFVRLAKEREYLLWVSSKQGFLNAQADIDRFFNSLKEIPVRH